MPKKKSKNKHKKRKNSTSNTKSTKNLYKSPVLNEAKQTWLFTPLDTLFFRESRPMNALGNAELHSIFPPSARTLIGAIRHALGEVNDMDWQAYKREKQQHSLAALIGYGDDLASLCFSGVWLHKDEQRLYPVPQNLIQKTTIHNKETHTDVFFLELADELTHCDLGHIRLPLLKKERAGSKPLTQHWLTEQDFQKVLEGEVPQAASCIGIKDLLVEEPRIGIACDYRTRSVKQGQLYQTKHIRLKEGIQLAMDISGLEQQTDKKINISPPKFVRLGGEGRIASIEVENTPTLIAAPTFKHKHKQQEQKIALYLLTPLLLDVTETWQPLPNFKQEKQDKQTVWKGTINGIALVLHTAITGKPQQEGGWDLVNNQPRAVQSYIPAGSVFYCTTEAKPQAIIEALHGKSIGRETNLGRGKLAVGYWV